VKEIFDKTWELRADPQYMIFNQFEEMGNPLWHYNVTGYALKDLYEAASIDGCGNTRFMFQMVFPLSKAIVAVIALYIAVGYWNSYFYPMIFLSDYSKLPLQNVLREILLVANMNTADTGTDPMAAQRLAQMSSVIKYSAIVISTVPIICVYPFIQKYFVQGVMIGSIKG
jgi:putative aldouronate transport system permease protein